MSPVSPARRRAEEFASLLEGRGTAAGSSRHAEALELVTSLRAVTAPAPSAAYVEELRANLMAAAETLLVPGAPRLTLPAVESRPRTRDRRIAVAIGTLALLGSGTGVAAAAQDSLPGDPLYPVKRVLESARTSLSSDDAARNDRIMDLAATRLDEAQALALRDSAESQAAIPAALEDFVAQATQAADGLLGEYAETGDTAKVEELRTFTADSLDVLAGLKQLVPAEFADAFDAAVNALLSLDEQALAACGAECGGLLDIPAILLSGAPIAPDATAPRAPAPRAQATPRAADPIAQLLEGLPVVGAKPSGSSPTTGVPTPSTSTSPAPATTDPDAVLDDTDEALAPVTDPLGGLLNGLLDPLVGDDGLL